MSSTPETPAVHVCGTAAGCQTIGSDVWHGPSCASWQAPAMPTTERHACHLGYVRTGDTIVRSDVSQGVVTDVQHYRAPFAGRVADVLMADGRRYNGVTTAAVVAVIPGPDHGNCARGAVPHLPPFYGLPIDTPDGHRWAGPAQDAPPTA